MSFGYPFKRQRNFKTTPFSSIFRLMELLKFIFFTKIMKAVSLETAFFIRVLFLQLINFTEIILLNRFENYHSWLYLLFTKVY